MEQEPRRSGRTLLVICGIVALVVVFAWGAPRVPLASANVVGDLWQKYVAPHIPFGSKAPAATSTTEGKAPVPLYQPAIDYEKAVVAAIKKSMPAVAAIIISKNVPIIEDCPVPFFNNLPPEYQDLFDRNFEITRPCEKGTRLQEVGGGSGFIISSDGLILTNKHVASDAKAEYTVFTSDGKKYDAKVLARDPVQDLAVMKIDAVGLPTVELGDSDSIELGQTAIAIGNALSEFRNTVSVGVISGLARDITAGGQGIVEEIQGVIQTDAAINPGNSGGPLLNLRGEVIGINTAVASGAENIGFAIPINDAKRAINSVKATGEIQTAYLGVRYLSLTPESAKKQGLSVEYGALVRGTEDGPGVIPDSPAAKAGLMAEDVILEVNGKKIDAANSLGSIIAKYGVGDTVTLKVLRGDKELEFTATFVKRPQE